MLHYLFPSCHPTLVPKHSQYLAPLTDPALSHLQHHSFSSWSCKKAQAAVEAIGSCCHQSNPVRRECGLGQAILCLNGCTQPCSGMHVHRCPLSSQLAERALRRRSRECQQGRGGLGDFRSGGKELVCAILLHRAG